MKETSQTTRLGRNGQVLAAQVAHVRPLEHGHAGILAQLRVELAVADVERDHARGAGLEEAVGEAAGRGADVETVLAGDVEAESLERGSELLAAARDEARARGDLELRALLDLLAGLRVPLDAPGEHERLRLRAALGEPALDEQHVQALLGAHGESVPRHSRTNCHESGRGEARAARLTPA